MRNAVRTFVALWYLFGWMLHVHLGLFAPNTYLPFGDTALIPAYTIFWRSFVMPDIAFFALLLAAFEILVGCLLISKGKWVRLGLVLSLLFNLFLVQMGLGYPVHDLVENFMVNRLPNLVFIVMQIPMLWGADKNSIIEIIQIQLLKLKAQSIRQKPA